MLTQHPRALQPRSPPRQGELVLNYTKQIGSINIFFLDGYIKIKTNGNFFSIRAGQKPLLEALREQHNT